MWNDECTVIPVVVGSLGAVSHKFGNYLKMIPAELSTEMCVKITLEVNESCVLSCQESSMDAPADVLIPIGLPTSVDYHAASFVSCQ